MSLVIFRYQFLFDKIFNHMEVYWALSMRTMLPPLSAGLMVIDVFSLRFFNACFSDTLILVSLGDQMVRLSISVLTNLKKAEILGLDLEGGNDTDFFFSFEFLIDPCVCPSVTGRESTVGRSMRSMTSVVSLLQERHQMIYGLILLGRKIGGPLRFLIHIFQNKSLTISNLSKFSLGQKPRPFWRTCVSVSVSM